MFTGYILHCQEVITIVMNSWYCSERPPWKKDRATPWPVLLCFIHRGLGGVVLCRELVTTFASAKALWLVSFKGEGRARFWQRGHMPLLHLCFLLVEALYCYVKLNPPFHVKYVWRIEHLYLQKYGKHMKCYYSIYMYMYACKYAVYVHTCIYT